MYYLSRKDLTSSTGNGYHNFKGKCKTNMVAALEIKRTGLIKRTQNDTRQRFKTVSWQNSRDIIPHLKVKVSVV